MDATASTTNSLNVSNALSPNVPQVRVVPMVPGMRTRKRSSMLSGNSTAGSINTAGENDDMDSVTDNDSMRPLADYTRRPRSHKRQRRTILDAFNSISLKGPIHTATNSTSNTGGSDRVSINSNIQAASHGRNCQAALNGKNYIHHQYQQHDHLLSLHHSNDVNNHANHHQYNDDADSSRAVADNEHNDGGYTTSSSLEDEFDDDDDINDNDDVAYEDDETATLDEQMLSDKELIQKNVERKVMLELVFGPESTFVPPKDPVDRKLNRLINHTIQRAARNSTATSVSTSQPSTSAVDDTMDISETINSFTNPINDIVVQTSELQDDVSLATTTGGYNSTVSSDSGGGNTNANSDIGSIHSLQTDAALMGTGKKLKSRRKNIRFLFQRSNSLPDNLFTGSHNTVTTTIDTVAEEMDTTDQI